MYLYISEVDEITKLYLRVQIINSNKLSCSIKPASALNDLGQLMPLLVFQNTKIHLPGYKYGLLLARLFYNNITSITMFFLYM